jgi:hypothetical protein
VSTVQRGSQSIKSEGAFAAGTDAARGPLPAGMVTVALTYLVSVAVAERPKLLRTMMRSGFVTKPRWSE